MDWCSRLITSIGKMLDGTVYNENSNAICYYSISRKIVNTLSKDDNLKHKEYYSEQILLLKQKTLIALLDMLKNAIR